MNERTQDRQTPGEGPALDEPAQASAAQDPDEEPALTRPLPRQRRWPWIAGILLGVAVLAAAAWLWLSQGSEEQTKAKGRGDPNARTMPVVAAAARKGSIEVYITALGTVVPRNMVVVRTRVDGQLMTVAFREGQTVKAGELLAQIDPRPFEVQLAQAAGQMARDQAQLKNAQVDLERYRTLLAQDSIAKQQVDTQEALVRQYQGAVASDQGAVDNAKLQLTYSRIIAPISGRVGLRQVDPGNMVHASDANGLVTITQVQPITVVFPIPEDNVPRVMKRMQSVSDVTVDAFDRDGKTKLATGRLLTIDNQIDTATGTIKLKAEFPNQDSVLFPNQFVNVRMAIETHQDATLVPTPAIQRGAPGTFVFLVKEDRSVSVTPVKLGAVEGETTEVQGGVAPGNFVVVDGADKLREGSKVELIDRNAQAQQPADTRRAPQGEGKGVGERGGRRFKGGG